MKKLTAGIFATLLAVVSTGAANADIASSGYVDEQVGTRVAQQQGTNNGVLTTSATGQVQVSTGITQAQVTGLTTALDAKANAADVYDKTTADGKFQTLENLTTSVNANPEQASGTKYPSEKAVSTAIQGLTGDVTGKVDVAQGAEDANKAMITDGTGNVVTGEIATGMIANQAVTAAKIANGTVTETQLSTSVNASLDLADSALQNSDVSQTVTDGDTAPVSGDAVVGYVTENAYSLTPATEENLGGVKASDAVTVTEDGTMGIGAGAVGTTELAADAVTNANLADNAVQTENITAGAVTNAKLAADSVQSANIADGTITNADIAATAAIAMSKIDGLAAALEGLIKAPTAECEGEGAECVLKINAGNYEWEVIKRGAAE